MRRVCQVATDGHVFAMKNTRPGMMEYQVFALFNWYCSWNGCNAIPYTPICGSGKNSAILHYNANSKVMNDGELILNDMGCRENMYCSDITYTYPVNGKFTEKQKQIYNIVLETNEIMFSILKPGATYKDVDTAGRLHMVQELNKLGFFNLPEKESDYPEGVGKEKTLLKLSSAFMPHGWGHFIGLFTHDIGHFKYSENQKKICHTGVYQYPFEAGQCVTDEPGIYFIPTWLNQYKEKTDDPITKFFNFDKIFEYIEVGGVRIEDVVLIKEGGAER